MRIFIYRERPAIKHGLAESAVLYRKSLGLINFILMRHFYSEQDVFPFAKMFCNFCKRECKFVLSLRYILREKIALCAILRKLHFAQNCAIPLVPYSLLRIGTNSQYK